MRSSHAHGGSGDEPSITLSLPRPRSSLSMASSGSPLHGPVSVTAHVTTTKNMGNNTTSTSASTVNARRQIVGRYELGKVLAVGDFDCWTRMCTHVVTGAEYVVRTYRKDTLREVPWMWNRVHDSIHVQRFLPKHEGIVEMVECFETESAVYILMQLFPSVNVTKLYTTRHLASVAPFLAPKRRRSPGVGRVVPLMDLTPSQLGNRLAGSIDMGQYAAAGPSSVTKRSRLHGKGSARSQKHKARLNSRQTSRATSPPSPRRLAVRTPPLEQLDIRYTSPPPTLRPAGSGHSPTPGTPRVSGSPTHHSAHTERCNSGREDDADHGLPRDADGLVRSPLQTSLGEDSAAASIGDASVDEENDVDDDAEEDEDEDEAGVSKVPIDTTRQLFIQVVRAVQHMHRHSVVHLGLAPDHVMVSDRGVAKVGNLISCRQCQPGETLRELRGTRHTVAPEVLRGEAYDPFLADSWSLGVLLYFMLNDGRYPHDGANTLQHVLYQHVRPPNPSIPPAAKDLLSRLLQMTPVKRLSVDAILMHPFCVGTWQQMEERSHQKVENSTNPTAVAAAAAATAAQSVSPFTAVDHDQVRGSGAADEVESGGTHPAAEDPNSTDAAGRGAGADAGHASEHAGPFFTHTPTIATSPLVISSAKLLGAPRRHFTFLDDPPLNATRSGGASSAFARPRGVFLRAPGASAHVWGQGQGEYGLDAGAGAGLAFEVQPVPSSPSGVATTTPFPSGVIVARVSGLAAAAGGTTSAGLWARTQPQRVKAINAAALLGSRSSVVQSYWDPVQETFSMDIPPNLTRENEAAYVIQHTYRAFLHRRRYARATRRLNRIGWLLFEHMYASPPPPPPAEDVEEDLLDFGDGRRRSWPRQQRISRGGAGVMRSRSLARGDGRQNREVSQLLSPGHRPRGLTASQRGERPPPSPSSRSVADRSVIDTYEGPGADGGPSRQLPYCRGSSRVAGSGTATTAGHNNNTNHYEIFSIDSSMSGSSKPASHSGSLPLSVLPSPHGSVRRTTMLPGGGSIDGDDGRGRHGEDGVDDVYVSGGRASYARTGRRDDGTSQLVPVKGLPRAHGRAASAVAAAAVKGGERESALPVVSAKDDCPLCHRPPPQTKKISTMPYAFTKYAYKNGDFTRSSP